MQYKTTFYTLSLVCFVTRCIFTPSLYQQISKPELNKRIVLPVTQGVSDVNFGS